MIRSTDNKEVNCGDSNVKSLDNEDHTESRIDRNSHP